MLSPPYGRSARTSDLLLNISLTVNATTSFIGTLFTYLNDNMGLEDNLSDAWSQSIAFGQEKTSIAGAVTILQFDHDADARIASGAQINQDAQGHDTTGTANTTDAFRTDTQTVVVDAQSTSDLISIAGQFQTPGISGQSSNVKTWRKGGSPVRLDGPRLMGGTNGEDPKNTGKVIVTFAPSTGERYLSTPLAEEARAQVGS